MSIEPPAELSLPVEAGLPWTVILNARSGEGDGSGARDQIGRALGGSAGPCEILEAAPGQLTALVREQVERARTAPRAIVAAGGDGTIATVAGALLGTNIPMGVIPLGTFNYFARNLGIPPDIPGAVGVLQEGFLRRLPLACVNDRVFIINSSFGLYRRLQEEREHRERRFGRNKIVAIISSLMTLLREHRRFHVRLDLDRQPVVLHTPLVFFAFNTLQLEKLGLPHADCTARGLLAVLAPRSAGRWQLLSLALRGALQTLGDSPNLVGYCAGRIEVHLPGTHRLKVALDGETAELTLPLSYRVVPDAISVFTPRVPHERQ